MKQIVLAATLLIFSAVSVHAQNDSEEEIPEDEEVNLSRDDEKDVSLPSGEVGKYVVIPKAGGRDWAILYQPALSETHCRLASSTARPSHCEESLRGD